MNNINEDFLQNNMKLLIEFCKTKRPYYKKNNETIFNILYKNGKFIQISYNNGGHNTLYCPEEFIIDILSWYTKTRPQHFSHIAGNTNEFVNKFLIYYKLKKI